MKRSLAAIASKLGFFAKERFSSIKVAPEQVAKKNLRIAMIACPAWAVWAPNPALLLLSAQVRAKGYEIAQYDLNLDAYLQMTDRQSLWLDENSSQWESQENVEQLFAEYRDFFANYVDAIADKKPGLVCFTVNTGSRFLSIILSRLVRDRLPEVPIIFGGADCFRSEFFNGYMLQGVVDAVCVGEGDIALLELIEALDSEGRIPSNLPGFLTWENDKIIDNGDAERPVNLDAQAPITLDGVDISRYTMPNRLTMSISRGCINRCAFCSESPNFGKFRTHSAEWMINQLKMILPQLAVSRIKPHINFNDSLINGNMKVLDRLCDLILSERLDFTWGGMAYIREEMSSSMLQKMKSAGCVEICWGIESGSAAVLKAMKKRFTPEMLHRVINDTASAGIAQYGNLIVGFPGEGPQEFAETLLFLIRNINNFSVVGLPLMVLRKNSPLYEAPEKFGIGYVDAVNWCSEDGCNTPKVRMLRRSILEQVVSSKKFDLGKHKATKADIEVDAEKYNEYMRILESFINVVCSFANSKY